MNACVSQLRDVIRQGILTREPHCGVLTGGDVFSGSYDWHSCVHAHWALLGIARLTADAELEGFLASRLTDEALERERGYLSAQPDFELPYGRAWFLLLLMELERRGRGVGSLRAETEAAVLGWLTETPFSCGGQHASWLFTWWLASVAAPSARLRALYDEKVTPAREAILSFVHTERDFLHLPSILALVDDTVPPPKGGDHLLAITRENAHSAGAAVTRLWPAGESDEKFEAGLEAILARPEQWRESFHFVSHWVPQFMWMALWLRQGRP